jgi:uncharacterized protein YbaR (Trm112 family)/DNA-directed RNA polymerase subunit RPC12/RpoP
MNCSNCKHSITPGMEIKRVDLDEDADATSHCPYCLHPLQGSTEGADLSVERLTLRREIRQRFVDTLLAKSTDGRVRCPVCEHRLGSESVLMLRSCEQFVCPVCSHDLIAEATRREVYAIERWQPVINALADEKSDECCANCSVLGAAARSCQLALSWIPGELGKQNKLLATLVRHPDQRPPEADCLRSCKLARHYQEQVGKLLLAL